MTYSGRTDLTLRSGWVGRPLESCMTVSELSQRGQRRPAGQRAGVRSCRSAALSHSAKPEGRRGLEPHSDRHRHPRRTLVEPHRAGPRQRPRPPPRAGSTGDRAPPGGKGQHRGADAGVAGAQTGAGGSGGGAGRRAGPCASLACGRRRCCWRRWRRARRRGIESWVSGLRRRSANGSRLLAWRGQVGHLDLGPRPLLAFG